MLKNYKGWGMQDYVGNVHGPGTDNVRNVLRLKYFLMSFPPAQLETNLRLTNQALVQSQKKALTKGELLKYCSMMILCTRYKF